MRYACVLWTLVCFLFSQLLWADDSSVEYKIKAGYLYNFTKFITWSEDNDKTFNLCILGDNPFGELIDPIEQRSAMGRPIKIFRFDNFGSMGHEPHCHILFVSPSIKNMPPAQNLVNTLVVGESGGFIDQGGMIGFVNKDGKIKLQINQKTIEQSGLKISAKLLEVADTVKGVNND
ncbi:MAG: YfiR family protein [Methylococcales bacterium]|nr:YfiR family protein [Methylococcales bacterium]